MNFEMSFFKMASIVLQYHHAEGCRHSSQTSHRHIFSLILRVANLYWICKLKQGLPYIPRVHLSEGSLVRSPLRWLCSEEPIVRRNFIPKFLYSESCYVPKIPYSERPPTIWILCYEGSLVRSSSSPKVLCSELPYSENRPSPIRVLYYEGPFVRSPSSSKIAMFRRFYLPNFARSIRIVCCEGSLFWKF